MAGLKFTNNASTLLASEITTEATELTVQASTGALFPSLAEGEWFPLVVVDSSGNREIMRATARSADLLTVTRGQEGTAARSFDPGSRVDLRVTAAALAEFALADDVGELEADLEAAVNDAITTLRGELNAPAGTRSPFNQSAAPTGWNKESNTAYNDAVVTSTTGNVATAGTVAASEFFARTKTDGRAITQAQLPNVTWPKTLAVGAGTLAISPNPHGHEVPGRDADGNNEEARRGAASASSNPFASATTSLSITGAPSLSGDVTSGGSGSAHDHDIDCRVKRYSVIIAQKAA